MVSNYFAYIHDAGLLAIMSTVITLYYLFLKLAKWITDSFYALPNKTERSQVMTASSRNLHPQATTQGNQSNTGGQSTDSGQQTGTNGNGLRER